MDSLTVLLIVLAAVLVLGLASVQWGVDSRESVTDDRRG